MINASTHASPVITVGDVTVAALLDVDLDFPIPIDEVFPGATADQWEVRRSRHPEAFTGAGGWRYLVTCYVIHIGDRRILVDTGCGPASLAFPSFLGVAGRLRERLAAMDVSVDEIDTVVITHIHPDHVGGVLSRDGSGPAFPRARFIVPRADWEAWRRPEVQEAFPVPYVGDTIAPLIESGRVDLVEGEHSLCREIILTPTPGHTPGSSSVVIDSGGDEALLVGDIWLHPSQVTEPSLACAFDMVPELAAATRAALAARIAERAALMGACHFPQPFGQIVRLEGRHHWIPVADWHGATA